MADVRFAPPLLGLNNPPNQGAVPPPPPGAVATVPPPPLRLSAPAAPMIRETSGISAISFQDLLQPGKIDTRPTQRKKKKGGHKLFGFVVFLGLVGGAAYAFRNSAPVQKILGHEKAAAPLPDLPFVRPTITSAEYTVTLSAVQNGVPKNVTTRIRADYLTSTSEATQESQVGGTFTTSQETRTADYLYRPGADAGATWTRQPRTPDTPATYDTADIIPMVNDIVDQPLREAMQPTSSKTAKIGDVDVTATTYVIDRARVPEIAPAIFARVPWLFDVPNASTLTVEVSYDKTGVVRHLAFRVDPPQPGTGSDATWVTSYTMDVSALNTPVTIDVPFRAVDVPAGTP
jgi:hypothetical protein